MIAAGLVLGVVLLGWAAWWAIRRFTEHGKHAGSGEGALTVRHLLAEAARDTGGRHRLREPTPPHCGLASALNTAETRPMPRIASGPTANAHHDASRDPVMLQRILTALQQI